MVSEATASSWVLANVLEALSISIFHREPSLWLLAPSTFSSTVGEAVVSPPSPPSIIGSAQTPL